MKLGNMKKKKIITLSILGLSSALALAGGVAIINNLNNNQIKEEELFNDNFIESTESNDEIFGGGLKSIEAFDSLSYRLDAPQQEDALFSPKLGVQVANNGDDTISVRYTAAITSLNVDAVWTRTAYDDEGNVVKKTAYVQAEKAYTAVANGSESLLATAVTVEDGDDKPYKYFVTYVMKNIPYSAEHPYKLDVSLTISQDANKTSTKTGSVDVTPEASMSSYTYDLSLITNNTYHSNKNTSYNNGQYINGKLKTIYSTNDNDLDISNLTLGVNKTQNATTTTSYILNDDLDDFNVTATGFRRGYEGAQTITVTYGTASTNYNIYVLDPASQYVYKDANNNYVVTVDQAYKGEIGLISGSNGNMFTTISQALEFLQNTEFVPYNANKILNILEGTYNEKLEITTPNLTINGSGVNNTKIEWDSLYGIVDPNGFTNVTDSTMTVAVRESAVNCKINDITISNKYNNIDTFDDTKAPGYTDNKGYHEYSGNGERALALLVQSDQFVMKNSALLGWQDTLELFTGRQYFKNTKISGNLDYIFGTNNTTMFEDCNIHTVKGKTSSTAGNVNGYVVATKGQNANSSDAINYGIVFNNCNFTSDNDYVGTYALVRPWTSSTAVAVINSKLDAKAGYSDGALAESKAIVPGLINDVNVVTLKIKLYGLKDSGNSALTITNDLSNVDTTLTSATDYTTYSTIFGKSNGGVSYALSWDPINGLETDHNTYYVFHGSAPTTGTVVEFDELDCNVTGNYVVGDITFNNCQRRTSGNDDLYVGGSIEFSVLAGTTVTINSYPGYHAYKIGNKYANENTVTYYFNEDTDVKIEKSGSDAFYLYSIVINSTNQSDTSEYQSLLLSKDKLEFYEGDSLDISSVKVYADYGVGYVIPLTNEYSTNTTGVVMNTPGNYSVTYSYNDISKDLSIVVKENVVESLTISGQKKSYAVGDDFDDTMTVTATYSNGTYRVLDSSEYYIEEDADMDVAGTYPITVVYKEDTSVTKSYDITVSAGEYSITFYDGETQVGSCNGTPGTSIVFPSTTKSGYQFVRYYLDDEFTEVFDENQISNENKTVYLRYMKLNESGVTYVSTESELVSAISNQRTIWLTNDIDMTGSTYTGIGNAWAGNINGYGYTISNWTPTYTTNQLGFFGNAYQGTIEDVIFKDCIVSDGGNSLQYLGLLTAGTYDDEIIKNVYIINCSMNTSKSSIIGLIGTVPQAHGNNPSLAITNLVIEDCSVAGTQYIGGLFGYVQKSTVISITNSSIDVSCTTSGAKIIGGIAGQIQGSASISVNNSMIDLTIESGDTYIGGVVGYAKAGTITVSNTSIELDISAAYSIGGVIGETVAADVTVSLSNDYVTGSIVVSNGSSNYENTYVGHNGDSYNYSSCTYSEFTLTGANATFQGTEEE